MGDQKNIIELNGKRYDALNGKIITDTMTRPKNPKPVAAPVNKGVNMDGISRSHKPSAAEKRPAQGIHKKTEGSKTLMRKSVRKPQPIVKQASPTAMQRHVAPATDINLHRPQKAAVDPERIERAQHIKKSKLISRFSDAVPRAVGKPSVAELKVKPNPEAPKLGHIAAKATSSQAFQHHVDKATSHQQPKLKKPRVHHRVAHKLRVSPRLVSVASASFAALLIGGFFAYQNVPNLAMRVASTRAGVHASMPSYQPAGFAFTGPIKYKPGQITVNFKNNTDAERNFSITQSTSGWNSQALLENYVAASNRPYQTFEDNGKTIYIYDGSNATWVDGGIWYNVQGKSSLNNDQLLRIADSI